MDQPTTTKMLPHRAKPKKETTSRLLSKKLMLLPKRQLPLLPKRQLPLLLVAMDVMKKKVRQLLIKSELDLLPD